MPDDLSPPETSPENDTILLMFSGGIDSTYMLYDYLLNSEHPVHVHHISLRYPRLQRWRTEDPASEKIVDWCREHLRDFEYSTSRFDLGFHFVGYDSDIQLLVAAKVAMNLRPKRIRVALGWCMDDLMRENVRARQERSVTANLWTALCESAHLTDLDRELAMPLLEQGLTKSDIVAKLPGQLLAFTWSCRRPTFEDGVATPCGTCHSCQARAAAGLTVDAHADT